MYPLVPILAIAAARRDRAVRWYALPLAIIGAAISTWHILVERFPSLESGACDPTNPCTIIWVEKLGYLTIPTMALSGFVVIGLLLVLPQEMP
jgi:disulfide bond formation protein DsbB